jgi:hypothetical protein
MPPGLQSIIRGGLEGVLLPSVHAVSRIGVMTPGMIAVMAPV